MKESALCCALKNPGIISLLMQHMQAPHFYVSSYSGENVTDILLSLTRYVPIFILSMSREDYVSIT